MKKYKHIRKLLCSHGHSTKMATKIISDACKGNNKQIAIDWIKAKFHARKIEY